MKIESSKDVAADEAYQWQELREYRVTTKWLLKTQFVNIAKEEFTEQLLFYGLIDYDELEQLLKESFTFDPEKCGFDEYAGYLDHDTREFYLDALLLASLEVDSSVTDDDEKEKGEEEEEALFEAEVASADDTAL